MGENIIKPNKFISIDFILKTAKGKPPLHENSFVKATAS